MSYFFLKFFTIQFLRNQKKNFRDSTQFLSGKKKKNFYFFKSLVIFFEKLQAKNSIVTFPSDALLLRLKLLKVEKKGFFLFSLIIIPEEMRWIKK